MKVLLVNPPIRENEPPRHIPIGLAIIANVLLDEGHEVKVLDINAGRYSRTQVQTMIDLKSKYDVIGTGGLITTYKYLKWLIPELKSRNPESQIVVGGGVVTENPEFLLTRTPADIAVVGEGEETMKEVVYALENCLPLKTIKGLAYKTENGEIKVNLPRPLIRDLDSLPFPAYHLFPVDVYMRNVAHASIIGKRTEMGIITSRGCPYNCNYCYHIFGRGARTRSVGNVIEEIKLLVEKYGVESILLLDDTFTINKRRVMEFCNRMMSEKIGLPWSCYARVNLVDWEMLETMKRAGCYMVGYGIESGSQRILNNMNKQVKVQQAEQAIKMTRNAGLVCGTTFMFGYPGENLETIKETVDFCKQSLISTQFFFTTPYPGTKLYAEAKDRIIKKYVDEEKFIQVLGDASEFTINLTDFSDEELFKLKEESEKELRKKSVIKWFKLFYIWHKQLGLRLLIKYAVKKMRGLI